MILSFGIAKCRINYMVLTRMYSCTNERYNENFISSPTSFLAYSR